MGLLDLPLLSFQFPREPEPDTPSLLMTLDLTGDIQLDYPNGLRVSKQTVTEFISFCDEQNQKHLFEFLRTLIADARGMVPLSLKWPNYQRRLKKAFGSIHFDLKQKGIWECLEALKKKPNKPFSLFSNKRATNDIWLLEVTSELKRAPGLLIKTRMDWKNDFSQVISPQAMGLQHVFECHVKAIEMALAIKLMIQDFLIDLLKRIMVLL